MPSRGKNKGNTGERHIADFLTKSFGEKFMRVPNSGALLGGSNAHRKQHLDEHQISMFKSDIIPPSSMRKLVVESKFYAEFPFHKLMQNEPIAQLDKWIGQTLVSLDEGDFWVVVIRINRKGSFAVFDQKWLSQLQVQNHVRYFSHVMCDWQDLITQNTQVIRRICATV